MKGWSVCCNHKGREKIKTYFLVFKQYAMDEKYDILMIAFVNYRKDGSIRVSELIGVVVCFVLFSDHKILDEAKMSANDIL